MQWFLQNWQSVLIGALVIETAFARVFPNVGFLQEAEKDLKAVADATGTKVPPS
jgi:hypothetical protein